jgi:hypothetical protein
VKRRPSRTDAPDRALLAEIRAAFPPTPYPSDQILSKCWCEECAWSVRRLRGKSWKQVRPEDFNPGDGGHLSSRAFRYYLPALLAFAVQHPDEVHFASEINGRLVFFTGQREDKLEAVQQTVSHLSKLQRTMLIRFLQWLQNQGWQAPMLIDAAVKAVAEGRVDPIPLQAFQAYCRAQELRSKKL